MQTANSSYLTCTEAAKLAPGRPSANCVWRWCRRGVVARNGQRIRLQHIRLGGKILTKLEWLEAFGESLASADSAYFERDGEDQNAAARHDSSSDPMSRQDQRLDAIESELDEAGL